MFYVKRYSQKFYKIHRKTPLPESGGIPKKWDPGPGTLHLEPFTWDPGPKTHRWDLVPGTFTWDPGPGTLHLNSLPGTRDPICGNLNTIPLRVTSDPYSETLTLIQLSLNVQFSSAAQLFQTDSCTNLYNMTEEQITQLKTSGNVNEVIRTVLNSLLLLFFFTKRFCTYQKHQKHKDSTKQKHKNANKRISDFFDLRCFLCA